MMRKLLMLVVIAICIGTPLFAAGQSDVSGSALEDIGFHASGLPVVDTPVTISVVWNKWASHTKDPSEMIVPVEGNKEMNINVDWIAVASEAWTEKINLMLASGDLPDTFATSLRSDFNVVSQGEAGAFIPMQDLLDNYAPNLKKIMAKRPTLEPWITAPDGNVYGVFKLNEGSWCTNGPILYLNKAWMIKMGLGPEDMPTSMNEYFDLLVKVKNSGDLNGNGEADEIPLGFMFENFSRSLAHFYHAHGLPIENGFKDNRDYLVVNDGEVIYAPTTQAFKDTMKTLNKFWEAGLLDQEGFTHTGGQYTGKGKQDQYFSLTDWWVQNWVPQERWDDYVYLSNIPADGYEYVANYRFSWSRNAAPITSAAEYPEVVMRWIDYWYDPIKSIEVMEGPIGVRVEQKADGTYDVMPTPEGMGLSEWRDLETLGPGGLTSIDAEMYQDLFIFSAAEMCGTVKYEMHSPFWPEEYWPQPVMTSGEIKTEQALLPDLQALVSKTIARFVTEGTVEEDWDEFQGQLKTLGLPELMQIWQKNYTTFVERAGGKMTKPHTIGTDEPYPGGWGHEPGSRL